MGSELRKRLRALSRRAGVSDVPLGVVAVAGIVLAAAVGLAAWVWLPRGTQAATFANGGGSAVSARRVSAAGDGATGRSGEATTVDASAAASACVVHVVGAVRHPGVYELQPGRRVIDAVSAAGGMRTDAAQAGINLAEPLQDGEQIVVPTEEELAKGTIAGMASGGAGAPASRAGGGAGSSAGGDPAAPVDINTADASLLDTLPGVGPATAAKIVADRAANGPFKSADDLGRVPGIGPKKLEQLKAHVRVR